MNNTEQPSKSDIQEIPPHEFEQAFHPNYSYVDICRICYQRGKAKPHEHGFEHIPGAVSLLPIKKEEERN